MKVTTPVNDITCTSKSVSSRLNWEIENVQNKNGVAPSSILKSNEDALAQPKETSPFATEVVKMATPVQDITCTSKSVEVKEMMNTTVTDDIVNIVGKEKPSSILAAKGGNKNDLSCCSSQKMIFSNKKTSSWASLTSNNSGWSRDNSEKK